MTLRSGCLLLIGCLTIQAGDLQQSLTAYQDLYKACITEGKRMDPDVIAKVLNELKSHFKEYPEAFLNAGDFYFRTGDSDGAIREYQEGMDTDSTRKVVYQKRVIEVLIRQNKTDLAHEMDKEILRANPQDPEARGLDASFLLDKGDVDTAMAELKSVVEVVPDNHVAQFNLGRAYFAKEDIEQARQQFELAIKIRRDYMPARLALTQLALRRGDPDTALELAQETLQINPSSGISTLLEAAAYLRKGQYDEARVLLEKLLKADPNQADALLELGVLNLAQKRYKEAEESFTKAYAVDPSNVRGLLGIVEIRFQQNEPEKAIQVIVDEVKKQPQRADLKRELANAEFRAKHYDEAIAQYQSILERYKESPTEQAEIYGRIGLAYQNKGDYPKAIENMEKASRLAPANVAYISQLAQFYGIAGRTQESLATYREALRIDPNNGVVLNNLAYGIASSGGDLDEALAMAQRARQQLPKMSEIQDTVGWIYLKKSLTASAVEVFRDLTDKVTDNSIFHYHYGMALAEKGDQTGALQELYRALELKPNRGEEAQIRDLIRKLSGSQ